MEFDKYIGSQVPWHWHREVELFYVDHGILEYNTPNGITSFPAGSGGIVNSNILHMTKPHSDFPDTIQRLHIFDTSLIGGWNGSLIEQKYISPLINAPWVEIVGLFPENPNHLPLINKIRQSFELSEKDLLYEIYLRNKLSEIWCELIELSKPLWHTTGIYSKENDKIKLMLIYIHEHYQHKLSIREIATAAYVSERECFRVFHDCLRTTPISYLNNYRLQNACHMLVETKDTITNISLSCGFGSSSYFGRIFLEYIGLTPAQYRRKWQNSAIFGQ